MLAGMRTESCSKESLGCWRDIWDNRAISGRIRLKSPDVDDCYRFAKEKGWAVFAVGWGEDCFTAANAHLTYKSRGSAGNCRDGVGGTSAIDVYRISCEILFILTEG